MVLRGPSSPARPHRQPLTAHMALGSRAMRPSSMLVTALLHAACGPPPSAFAAAPIGVPVPVMARGSKATRVAQPGPLLCLASLETSSRGGRAEQQHEGDQHTWGPHDKWLLSNLRPSRTLAETSDQRGLSRWGGTIRGGRVEWVGCGRATAQRGDLCRTPWAVGHTCRAGRAASA